MKAALDVGFDLPVYKTVRTRKYACHPWPNVLAVKVEGDLQPDKTLVGETITASRFRSPILWRALVRPGFLAAGHGDAVRSCT